MDIHDGMIDHHCKECNRKRDMAVLMQRKIVQREKDNVQKLRE